MSGAGGLAGTFVRRRWRSALILSLALGLGVGAGLSCIAAARRTASAYPRYLRDADAPDLVIDYSPREGDIAELSKAALAVDGVTAVRDVTATNVAKITDAGEYDTNFPFAFFAPTDRSTDIANRPHLVEGRLPRPDAANEVVINEALAELKHVAVGDHLEMIWISNEELAKAENGEEDVDVEQVAVDVVGLVVLSDEVVVDDIAGQTYMLGTEPFLRSHQGGDSYHRMLVQAKPGTDIALVSTAIRRAVPADLSSQILFQDRTTATDKAQRALRPLTYGLAALGALLLLTTLLLIGQALARQISLEQEEVGVLRALGVTASTRMLLLVARPLVIAVGGAVVAAMVAIALSPLGPVGAVRAVEATGVDVDLTVLAAGAAAVIVLLLARAAIAAGLAIRTTGPRRERAGRIGAAASKLPLTPALGVRSAVEPGSGRTRVAVRATIATATAAVFVVAALVTFDAGRRHLSHDPALYGWTWDVAVQAGAGYSRVDLESLEADPMVGDLAGADFVSVTVDSLEVPAVLILPVRGVVLPPIVGGRAPRDMSEVALGHDTLARLGKHVDDQVAIVDPGGERATSTIVGVAIFPALGLIDTERANLGTGAFTVAPLDPADESGPSTALMRAAPGTSRASLIRHVEKDYAGVEADTRVFERARPADLASFERLGAGPLLAVGLFVIAAVATLAHGIASAVRRRRRDHGLLRAVGFAPGQIRSIVIWQAVTTIVIALLVGVPLGVVAGRAGWRAVASGIGTRVELVVPSLLLLGLAAGMVVAAVFVALIPARAAARVAPAEALRTE